MYDVRISIVIRGCTLFILVMVLSGDLNKLAILSPSILSFKVLQIQLSFCDTLGSGIIL